MLLLVTHLGTSLPLDGEKTLSREAVLLDGDAFGAVNGCWLLLSLQFEVYFDVPADSWVHCFWTRITSRPEELGITGTEAAGAFQSWCQDFFYPEIKVLHSQVETFCTWTSLATGSAMH